MPARPFPQVAVTLAIESEAERLKAYIDPSGFLTIGIGHRCKQEEHYDLDSTITSQQAMEIYEADSALAASQVLALVKVSLNDHRLKAGGFYGD
jgi:GH24 family phage-related lysozyme (muramidase)